MFFSMCVCSCWRPVIGHPLVELVVLLCASPVFPSTRSHSSSIAPSPVVLFLHSTPAQFARLLVASHPLSRTLCPPRTTCSRLPSVQHAVAEVSQSDTACVRSPAASESSKRLKRAAPGADEKVFKVQNADRYKAREWKLLVGHASCVSHLGCGFCTAKSQKRLDAATASAVQLEAEREPSASEASAAQLLGPSVWGLRRTMYRVHPSSRQSILQRLPGSGTSPRWLRTLRTRATDTSRIVLWKRKVHMLSYSNFPCECSSSGPDSARLFYKHKGIHPHFRCTSRTLNMVGEGMSRCRIFRQGS